MSVVASWTGSAGLWSRLESDACRRVVACLREAKSKASLSRLSRQASARRLSESGVASHAGSELVATFGRAQFSDVRPGHIQFSSFVPGVAVVCVAPVAVVRPVSLVGVAVVVAESVWESDER